MASNVTLQSITTFSRDGEWGKDKPFDNAVRMRVIRGTDFDDIRTGQLDNVPVRYIAQRFAEYKTLQPDDIILETAGGSKNRPTGRTVFIKPSLIHQSELPLTCASFARFLRLDPAKVCARYLFWHLQYMYETGRLLQYHTQHTGVARFQYTTFAKDQALHLPPLSIQRKIAAILSAYDDLIENNTRRIAILEEMAQLIYREWFVHFRFPGHEDVEMVETELGLVPEGWEVKRLSEVAEVNQENISTKNGPDEIHYINISSVSPGRIDEVETMPLSKAPSRARRIVKHGDVIWSSVRPNLRAYALVFEPVPNTVASTGFAVITAEAVPFTYLYHALTTDDFVGYLSNRASGSAYPAVNVKDFKEAPVIKPEKALLEEFHRLTLPLVELKNRLTEKNRVLAATRDLLLPRLVSGELDVVF